MSLGLIFWQKVPDSLLESEPDAILFMTIEGFLYYLPAYMSCYLRNPEDVKGLGSMVAFALGERREMNPRVKRLQEEKISSLNAEQRSVVEDFCVFVAQAPLKSGCFIEKWYRLGLGGERSTGSTAKPAP